MAENTGLGQMNNPAPEVLSAEQKSLAGDGQMKNPEPEILSAERKSLDGDGGDGDVPLPNQEEQVKLEAKEDMKPWEQHSAVISIPRFDYNAPSSILNHSHSGFLVTCPLRREKSATKEAMLLFEKYISHSSDLNEEVSECLDVETSPKRRRICGSPEHELDNNTESKEGKCAQSGSRGEAKASVDETSSSLSLVKLKRNGLLLFIFPQDRGPAVVDIVSQIILSRESGSLKSPEWCHRIFPFQATCNMEEKELHDAVIKLVQQFIKDERNKVVGQAKFAVGYHSRGFEESEMKRACKTSSGFDGSALISRGQCFSIVTAAVQEVIPDSVVDLKNPEVVVLVEVLPLSGIPNDRIVVGLSVLPLTLVSLKPRIRIKALVHDGKAGNEKEIK